MDDILDSAHQPKADQPMAGIPPDDSLIVHPPTPPPIDDKPKKNKFSPGLVIAGIFLLLVTLPLVWFGVKNSEEIRSRATGGSSWCPGGTVRIPTGGTVCDCPNPPSSCSTPTIPPSGGGDTTTPPGGGGSGSGSCHNEGAVCGGRGPYCCQPGLTCNGSTHKCEKTDLLPQPTSAQGCVQGSSSYQNLNNTCQGSVLCDTSNGKWYCSSSGAGGACPYNGCTGDTLCVGGICVPAPGNGKPAPCTAAQLANCNEVTESGGKECIAKQQCVYTNVECNYDNGTKWCFKKVESDCSGTCGGGGGGTPPPITQCTNIKVYKAGALLSTADLSTLNAGDMVTLAIVRGSASTKARFRVNSTSAADWHETSSLNSAGTEFVYDYTLDDSTTFTIQGQLFNGTIWQ